MHLKTRMRYHLTPVRMAIIKKSANNKYWKDVEKREPSNTVGGNVNWCSHYGEQYGGSLKTKNRTTIRPSNPTLGYISPENENTNSKRSMHPNVHSSSIHNSQDMEATQVSTDR